MNASPGTAHVAIPLTPAQFKAAISAALMAILLGALDQTVVSVAVPNISKELGGFEWMAWVISGYLIASTVVTPLYGKFSDLFGRRSLITCAIAVFLLASIGCAMAQSLPQLVIARVAQGIGGGGLIATAQAMIADVVPMRERGRFQVYVSAVWAGAGVAGPVLGGALTEFLSWPWIFWINLPLSLVALVLVYRSPLPAPRLRRRVHIDWVGIVLLLVGLTAFLIAITRVGQGKGWFEAGNLAGLAIAAVALPVFGWHEQRTSEPVIPLSMLRQPVVVFCCTILFVCFFTFVALSVLIPLREQLAGNASPGQAALSLLPFTLSNPIAAYFVGRWMYKSGRIVPCQRLGAWVVVVSLAVGAFVGPAPGMLNTVLNAFILTALGAGYGAQMPTTLLVMQNSVPQNVLGTVTALSAFFRLLGGAIGIAVLSSILVALLRDSLPPDLMAHGLEGLGALIGGIDQGKAGLGASYDRAFRDVYLIAAVLSLINVWCVSRLPDVRLDGSRAPRPIEPD